MTAIQPGSPVVNYNPDIAIPKDLSDHNWLVCTGKIMILNVIWCY